MQKDIAAEQPPILRFLIKHKWRIILPVLFATFYFALPRYFMDSIAVQQYIFVKSETLGKNELLRKNLQIRDGILSDEYLRYLIYKYDLYKNERAKGVKENELIERLKNTIQIRFDDDNLAEDLSFSIWINLKAENAQNIAALSDEITAQFENAPNQKINKYVSEPYKPHVYKNYVLFADIVLRGLLMFAVPLILVWEIPYLFFSPKTKKYVFDPIRADWQNELNEAKANNQPMKILEINLRYTFAFLAAMLQKSPIGDLFDFVSKIAKQ